MAWVRVEDNTRDHLKLRRAGSQAFALWNAALGWCGQHLTDGVIPKELLEDIWNPLNERFNAKAAAQRLVESGLWHDGTGCDHADCPASTGVATDAYVVHDYFEYQPSRDQVLREREQNAQRVSRHRKRLAASVSNAAGNGARNALPNATRNTISTATPTRPDPTRPGKDLDHVASSRSQTIETSTPSAVASSPGDLVSLADVEQLASQQKWATSLSTADIGAARVLIPITAHEAAFAVDETLKVRAKRPLAYFLGVVAGQRQDALREKPQRGQAKIPGEYVPAYMRPENDSRVKPDGAK